jgi:superfamily II DNA/RNA helicase
MKRQDHTLTTFRDLGVRPETADALAAVGITTPFAIQELALPVALAGNDVIGQAKTGTGKTLGFGIPLLERVVGPQDPEWPTFEHAGKAQALVVVPTRELCVQVARDLDVAGSLRGVRVLSVYGGRAYEPQVAALRSGVEVIVGTPGRLLDLAQQGHLALGFVRALVLDEADEMLDLGFLPDVERILRLLPEGRQTMLFSATMPGQVISLARQYMTQPTHIRAHDPDDDGRLTVAGVEQHVFRAHAMDKIEMLARILQAEGRGHTMVFCRTKRTAQKVSDDLAERGFAAASVHGDLGQGAREQALRAFRNGKVDVLVATDVAARGIDVEGVTHVVNYQCPEDEKTYLHRIGRTARAGAKGIAITFVDWDDIPRWTLINRALGLDLEDPPETYSTSEHLYSSLDIPSHVTGVLPRASRTREGIDAETVEDLGETGQARSRKPASGGRTSSAGSATGRSSSASRSSGSSGSRNGSSAPTESTEERPPKAPRTAAPRRRTRNGQSVDGVAAEPVGNAGVANEGAAGETTADGTRPRRRRRGGRGRGGSSGSTPAAATG